MKNLHPHILIVDDNSENIRVIGAALSQNKYNISIATHGDMALKMAVKDISDLNRSTANIHTCITVRLPVSPNSL
jgi:CheY-like chemotaxis protein